MRATLVSFLILLTLPFSCSAQSQNGSPQARTRKPPRKIWTNADLEALREKSGVSEPAQAAPSPDESPNTAGGQAPAESTVPAAPLDKARDPKWYAEQELPCQRELAQINTRLDRLLSFRKYGKGGTSGLALYQENIAITPEDAIHVLQTRRAEIERTIYDLEDQARRNGIRSGEIVAASRQVEVEEAKAAEHPEAAQEAEREEQEEELAALQLAEKIEREHDPETYWRRQFSSVYARLHRAQRELNVLQREWSAGQRQYYDDPNKALREQYTFHDQIIRALAIREKQKEIIKLRQELSSLEDDLRRSGGPPGWSRVD